PRELEAEVFVFAIKTPPAKLFEVRQAAELVIGGPDHDTGPIAEAKPMRGLQTKTFRVRAHNSIPFGNSDKHRSALTQNIGAWIENSRLGGEKLLLS
ncbi:MAG: hypothetical protein ACE5KY_01335, partial [Candidatus Tectimicrobiota bacterium]